MAGGDRRVLLICTRPGDGRLAALRDSLALDDSADILLPGMALPDPRGYDAVVLDGPQDRLDPAEVARLEAFVAAGGTLLAIGAAPGDAQHPVAGLLGARSDGERPWAEVFGKNAAPTSQLLHRVEPEFALCDTFAPLRPLNGEARVLLHVTWALRDEPVALERRCGEGRVVVSALGNSPEALQAPALRTLLRRALRQRNGARPERTLGIGIVGFGPYSGMGRLHATAAREVDGLRLAAVCDRSPERLAAAARELPEVARYASIKALVRDPAVDVAIVATPPATHATLALELLRAGKHVVCEKPLCLTVAEADALIAAAEQSEVALTVHQNRRWDPDYLAIRRAVDQGLLGELFNVETFVGGFDHPCRLWHSDVAASGGAIYDWGSHFLDWTLLLLPGLPELVMSNTHKRLWHDVTNADQVRVRLLWDDGREAEFLHSDLAAIRKPKFYLQGTAGTLAGSYRSLVSERVQPGLGYIREEAHFAEAPAELTLARYESGYGIVESRLPLAPAPRFAFHRNLADHLLLGEPLAVTAESVRRVIAVLEAAHRSAAQGGRPVRLDALAPARA